MGTKKKKCILAAIWQCYILALAPPPPAEPALALSPSAASAGRSTKQASSMESCWQPMGFFSVGHVVRPPPITSLSELEILLYSSTDDDDGGAGARLCKDTIELIELQPALASFFPDPLPCAAQELRLLNRASTVGRDVTHTCVTMQHA